MQLFLNGTAVLNSWEQLKLQFAKKHRGTKNSKRNSKSEQVAIENERYISVKALFPWHARTLKSTAFWDGS